MQKNLVEELEAVRAELRLASAADPDLLAVLGRVVEDVTTLTDEQAADHPETLRERLEDQAALFETEHPRLAGAVRSLIKALADLGV